MGWALTREDNEVTKKKDEREGKPVARQVAPMISKFIRTQWESEQLEGVDDERRQILEEAAELDHIWGVLEAEEEPTNEHQERLEARGYLSPTWRLLRALQSLLSAVQLQGESAVLA